MWASPNSPAVGIAYAGYVPDVLKALPQVLDFVEIPYELLRHDPSVMDKVGSVPIILHCASMSIASPELRDQETLDQIALWADRTSTPWIGEHLAFISAARASEKASLGSSADYNIGYTVSPPMNRTSAARIATHLRTYAEKFKIPLIVENSPLYFHWPSSDLSQCAFITAVLEQCGAGLLLDLAHLIISADTAGFDPVRALDELPLAKVVEVHISGVDYQLDGIWDNHAIRASDRLYSLLQRVLEKARPTAVTLEYNWSARFPSDVLTEEIYKVRDLCRT